MRNKNVRFMACALAAALVFSAVPAAPAMAAEETTETQWDTEMQYDEESSEEETEELAEEFTYDGEKKEGESGEETEAPDPHVITEVKKPDLLNDMFQTGTEVSTMKLPGSIKANGYRVDDGSSEEFTIKGMKWRSTYAPGSAAGEYTFTAVLPEGYSYDAGVEELKLTITITDEYVELETEAETETETESETETVVAETEALTEVPTEAPETAAPETEAPAVVDPQTDAPKTEETETTAPETEAPVVVVPETEAPAPETEVPETVAPETEAPDVQAETAAPKTATEDKVNIKITRIDVQNGKTSIDEANDAITIYLRDANQDMAQVILDSIATTPETDVTIDPADYSSTGLDFSTDTTIPLTVTVSAGTETETYHTYNVTAVICDHTDAGGESTFVKDEDASIDPTCTDAGEEVDFCSLCGTEQDIPLDKIAHTWGEWKVTKEATCTEAGSRERTCSVCGEKQTEEIAALGHSYNSDWTIDKEATCTEAGSKSHHCDICGEKVDVTEIPALGHDWGEWEVTKEATHTKKGEKERTCARCGDVEVKSIPKVNIIGEAKNNYIDGINEEANYATGTNISFTAVGDGMDNDKPIEGDVRYLPESWAISSTTGSWEKAPFNKTLQFSSAGTYTLVVNFICQEYIDGEWVQNGDDDTKTVDITVTGNTVAANGTTTNTAAQTGDYTPILALVVVLLLSGVLILVLLRKKKK